MWCAMQDPSELACEIIADCFSPAAIEGWENYMDKNEDYFSVLPSEYTHLHHEIYQEFISMIEERIAKKCAAAGINMRKFFEVCKHCEKTPAINVFNTVIVLTTDFEAFVDVMHDHRKRNFVFHTISQYRNMFTSSHK